jgi:hypothetical protein
MPTSRRIQTLAACAAMSLAAAGGALSAQTNTLGPPQLKDFQLEGERRPAPSPPPAQEQPAPQPAPPSEQPRAARPAPAEARPAAPAAPARRSPEAERTRAPAERPAPRSTPAPTIPAQPQDIFTVPGAPPAAEPFPQAAPPPAAESAPAPATAAPETGTSFWLYLIPLALLALGGAYALRRRRSAGGEAGTDETVPVAVAPAPRPQPVPRPWLELEFKAAKAASTEVEATIDFALVIQNTGKGEARNIRVNARLFNAGAEQDKEIGAFFRTRGKGRRTHVFPELPAGEDALIEGSVAMPRAEMRALKVQEQLLFIPVIAVNVVYDWAEDRTGQTSKSYVIGRELGPEAEKMGAFRLDLGPRVYRTVGQRQHSLARRV